MKNLLVMLMATSLVLAASMAFADRGHGGHDRYSSFGEKVEHLLDRKGDRIKHRFDHKAERADSRGKPHKADRLRNKGHRIDRHLDKKADRIRARLEHRHKHKHRNNHKRHRHYAEHRHHDPKPRVIYRGYDPYDTYFGIVINQPGLWLGWGWHN